MRLKARGRRGRIAVTALVVCVDRHHGRGHQFPRRRAAQPAAVRAGRRLPRAARASRRARGRCEPGRLPARRRAPHACGCAGLRARPRDRCPRAGDVLGEGRVRRSGCGGGAGIPRRAPSLRKWTGPSGPKPTITRCSCCACCGICTGVKPGSRFITSTGCKTRWRCGHLNVEAGIWVKPKLPSTLI